MQIFNSSELDKMKQFTNIWSVIYLSFHFSYFLIRLDSIFDAFYSLFPFNLSNYELREKSRSNRNSIMFCRLIQNNNKII